MRPSLCATQTIKADVAFQIWVRPRLMQPAYVGNRTVPLCLSSIWDMFCPDQAFPGEPHDATADAIAVLLVARRLVELHTDRMV